jgi:hypothetical protein
MGSGIQKKNIKSAIERIVSLEENIAEILAGVNKSFTVIGQALDGIKERMAVSEGLISNGGSANIDILVTEARAARAKANMEAAKAALEAAVAAGDLVETVLVGEQSLIVGQDKDEAGNVIAPGRTQILVSQLNAETKAMVMGKTAGEVITGANGYTLEVLQVFDQVVKAEVVQPGDSDAPTLAEVAPTVEGVAQAVN